MSQEKEMNVPSLADLIGEWIKGDPTLNEHFVLMDDMWHDDLKGSPTDFTINIKCRLKPYQAVVWFTTYSKGMLMVWEHLGDDQAMQCSPSDPEFFPKILKLLRDAHNGGRIRTAKGNSFYTTALGCKTAI